MALVGHGLTTETRSLLVDGVTDVVINQDPQAALMDSVSIFTNIRTGRPPLAGTARSNIEIVPHETLPWTRLRAGGIWPDCVLGRGARQCLHGGPQRNRIG